MTSLQINRQNKPVSSREVMQRGDEAIILNIASQEPMPVVRFLPE
jgi:hypothetical protein